jgi:DNA end-binding protein Ku
VRARDGVLTLTTMRFHDEVRPRQEVDAATQKSHKPAPKQLNAAVAVIEELSCEWKPERHKDEYRKRLQTVVDRKRKGETVKRPQGTKAPSPATRPDGRARAYARGDDQRGREPTTEAACVMSDTRDHQEERLRDAVDRKRTRKPAPALRRSRSSATTASRRG